MDKKFCLSLVAASLLVTSGSMTSQTLAQSGDPSSPSTNAAPYGEGIPSAPVSQTDAGSGSSQSAGVSSGASAGVPSGMSAGLPVQSSSASAELTPGTLLEARKVLHARVAQAKAEGIGTAPYEQALAHIEHMVRSGQPEDQVRGRIESVARSLKDQLDKSRILKTQRPIKPAAPASVMPMGAETAAAPPPSSKPTTADLIEKIKEKLSTGEIPDSVKEKFLNSEKGRQILQRLGQ